MAHKTGFRRGVLKLIVRLAGLRFDCKHPESLIVQFKPKLDLTLKAKLARLAWFFESLKFFQLGIPKLTVAGMRSDGESWVMYPPFPTDVSEAAGLFFIADPESCIQVGPVGEDGLRAITDRVFSHEVGTLKIGQGGGVSLDMRPGIHVERALSIMSFLLEKLYNDGYHVERADTLFNGRPLTIGLGEPVRSALEKYFK